MDGETGLLRAPSVLGLPVPRQGDEHDVLRSLASANLLRDLVAADSGKADVEEDDVRSLPGYEVQGGRPVPRRRHLMAPEAEQQGQALDRVLAVVHDQHPQLRTGGPLRRGLGDRGEFGGRPLGQRKADDELAAVAGAWTACRARPPVKRDQSPNHRESGARAPSDRSRPRSPWMKRSNTCGTSSALIPSPSSRTPSTVSSPSRVRRTQMWPPSGVNLAALPRRLRMTWARRVESPSTRMGPRPRSTSTVWFRCSRRGSVASTARETTAVKSS